MDIFSRDKRSDIMRRVRSAGTRPEMTVRSILKQMGIRYRACPPNLPGKPDVVVYRKQKAILVHGCFWHGHHCEAGKIPRTNRSYWKRKQLRNALRDSRNARVLRSRGWKLLVLWECEIRNGKRLESRISRFMRSVP
jgi:DNA mismatch endonuclease, patch repair protein